MEQDNFVNIELTKSCSKDGKEGYTINVQNSSLNQEQMDNLGSVALTTALKLKSKMYEMGL